MKLKKIASLALAGIMAVSVLAGCKYGEGSSSSSSSSSEETTTTGYSAMLGEKLAKTLMKSGLEDVVSFEDNADDQKALEAVALKASDATLEDWISANTLAVTQYNRGDFKADADLNRYITESSNSDQDFFTGHSMNTTKIGEVWVANSNYTLSQVLDKIADTYEAAFKGLETNNDAASSDINVDYHYTVSVSVVNKAQTSNTMVKGSVNFVAVTITRTAEVA